MERIVIEAKISSTNGEHYRLILKKTENTGYKIMGFETDENGASLKPHAIFEEEFPVALGKSCFRNAIKAFNERVEKWYAWGAE